jgi:hypothetical protein
VLQSNICSEQQREGECDISIESCKSESNAQNDANLNVSVDSLYYDEHGHGPRRYALPLSRLTPHNGAPQSLPLREPIEEKTAWSPCISQALFAKYYLDPDSVTSDELVHLDSQIEEHLYNTTLNRDERKLWDDASLPRAIIRRLSRFRQDAEEDAEGTLQVELEQDIQDQLKQYPQLLLYSETIWRRALRKVMRLHRQEARRRRQVWSWYKAELRLDDEEDDNVTDSDALSDTSIEHSHLSVEPQYEI